MGKIRSRKGNNRRLSSYEVFMKFAEPGADVASLYCVINRDGQGSCLKSVLPYGLKQDKMGLKNLKTHLKIRGKDKRKPFPKNIEPHVLKAIRNKGIWPCFQGKKDISIGLYFFPHSGYHEKKTEKERTRDEMKSSCISPQSALSLSQLQSYILSSCVDSSDSFLPELSEFVDVSCTELEKVALVREQIKEAEINYLSLVDQAKTTIEQTNLLVVSDLQILRFLRHAYLSVKDTTENIKCYLEWRIKFRVPSLILQLKEKFSSIASLQSIIKGTCSNLKRSSFGFIELKKDIRRHFVTDSLLNNFEALIIEVELRMLFLDTLSYEDQKVHSLNLVWDVRGVNGDANWIQFNRFDKQGCHMQDSSLAENKAKGLCSNIGWLEIANSWNDLTKVNAELISRFYGAYLKKLYILGKGVMFSLVGEGFLEDYLRLFPKCKLFFCHENNPSDLRQLEKSFDISLSKF
eukprot:snap_masked-scaffold_7-processed-gene-2.37-mRNA-1 protein AED:1.00 eAED:1.00 QI:0/0/0/0/1/1/2/0/461